MKKIVYPASGKVPNCLVCGKPMKPVLDTIARKYTGYIWRCDCMPNNMSMMLA